MIWKQTSNIFEERNNKVIFLNPSSVHHHLIKVLLAKTFQFCLISVSFTCIFQFCLIKIISTFKCFFFSCALPRPKNSMQLISNWIIICNFKSVAMARVYCVYETEIEKMEIWSRDCWSNNRAQWNSWPIRVWSSSSSSSSSLQWSKNQFATFKFTLPPPNRRHFSFTVAMIFPTVFYWILIINYNFKR